MTTLSTLLTSQEARDAAPCVGAQVGQWVLSRSGILGPVYEFGIAELKGYVFVGRPDDQIGDSATFDRDDIIWSGDLPAELAAKDAKIERLREVMKIAGILPNDNKQ
jgi:hypothetical protein